MGLIAGRKESGLGGEWGTEGLFSYCNTQTVHLYRTAAPRPIKVQVGISMAMSGNASVDFGEYLNIRSFTEMKLFIYDIQVPTTYYEGRGLVKKSILRANQQTISKRGRIKEANPKTEDRKKDCKSKSYEAEKIVKIHTMYM